MPSLSAVLTLAEVVTVPLHSTPLHTHPVTRAQEPQKVHDYLCYYALNLADL